MTNYELTFKKGSIEMTVLYQTEFVRVLKAMAVWKKDGYEITKFERII